MMLTGNGHGELGKILHSGGLGYLYLDISGRHLDLCIPTMQFQCLIMPEIQLENIGINIPHKPKPIAVGFRLQYPRIGKPTKSLKKPFQALPSCPMIPTLNLDKPLL
jgi:hypothetical protein